MFNRPTTPFNPWLDTRLHRVAVTHTTNIFSASRSVGERCSLLFKTNVRYYFGVASSVCAFGIFGLLRLPPSGPSLIIVHTGTGTCCSSRLLQPHDGLKSFANGNATQLLKGNCMAAAGDQAAAAALVAAEVDDQADTIAPLHKSAFFDPATIVGCPPQSWVRATLFNTRNTPCTV